MNTALARLRAKTDRELSILVARQLQRSLNNPNRNGYLETARVYESSRALLAVAEISPAERTKLERMLAELRSHLAQPATAVA